MKTVELEQDDWGQIVDGLICRAEQYELTAQYYETGFADGEILEVRDGNEAQNLAKWYRQITGKISEQLKNE